MWGSQSPSKTVGESVTGSLKAYPWFVLKLNWKRPYSLHLVLLECLVRGSQLPCKKLDGSKAELFGGHMSTPSNKQHPLTVMDKPASMFSPF